MRIQVLYGYRSRVLTDGRYLPKGDHDVDDGLGEYLVTHGHAVALDESSVKPPPKPAGSAEDLPRYIPGKGFVNAESATVAWLRDYAREHDINLRGATAKDDIIAAIEDWHRSENLSWTPPDDEVGGVTDGD